MKLEHGGQIQKWCEPWGVGVASVHCPDPGCPPPKGVPEVPESEMEGAADPVDAPQSISGKSIPPPLAFLEADRAGSEFSDGAGDPDVTEGDLKNAKLSL